ncbi:MAG: DHA2 family efflux MFS transporter permease subunit [Ktedonobacteraceae bacterium]
MQIPTSVTQPGRGRFEYKWIVAVVVIFGAFMSILDQTIVNIAIPRLQNAFGADLNAVQWVLTAYILTQGVVTPTTSFFADLLGTKRFYVLALSIFTLGSALCGLAWNLPVLIIFRILQGVGGAFLFPLAITMLYREFPVNQRGLASGIFGIAALLAPAVGPTLGGYFVTYADWPLIFFVNVPIGILGIILGIVLLREIPPGPRTRFDIPGFLLVASGLAAVLYALSDASTDGWGSAKVLGFLVGGLLVLCLFVIVELTIARRGGPVLVNLRLFANKPFLTSNIANILITFAFFGGLFLFPVYLQNLRGLNAFQSGLLLLPQAFASIVTALIGGRIVDRYGVRVVVIPGLLILGFTVWQLSSVTLDTPYWWLQILFVLRGLALGTIIQPLNVSALSEVRPQQFAQASALYTVLRFVATSLGIAVLATLVQTQAKAHYSYLAAHITSGSPIGQLISRLQALSISHGADPTSARMTAMRQALRLVQQEGYLLAIQDAFRLTLIIIIVAIVATALIRYRQRPAAQTNDENGALSAEEEAARAEARQGA